MNGRVIVFGSINLDTVMTVERIARPGETVASGQLQTFPGGKGGNQAMAAHAAGGKVCLVGRVGADAAAETMLRFYRDAGMALDHIGHVDGPTGSAFVQVEAASGENSIVVVAGANGSFVPADMARIELDANDVVLSQFEVPVPAIEALFNRARAVGARTVLNPAPAAVLSGELSHLVDDLIVNESELAVLGGEGEPVAVARALLAHDGQRIILTRGAEGAIAIDANGVIRTPGRRVEAVDTTGAGDCFCGVYAASIAAGDGVSTAIRVANAAASISVTRPGAASSMPTHTEIQAALEK